MQILPKVNRVYVPYDPEMIRIVPAKYDELRAKHPELPSWRNLARIGDREKLWMDNVPVDVFVEFKKNPWSKTRKVFHFRFFRFFIHDKASVPVAKDNMLESIIAARCHDVNFSCHYMEGYARHGDMGFRATNELFRKMIEFSVKETYGYTMKKLKAEKKRVLGSDWYTDQGWRKRWSVRREFRSQAADARGERKSGMRLAKVYKIAVSSIVGQALYVKQDRAFYHDVTSSFNEWDEMA